VLKEVWAADNGFLARTLTLKCAAIETRYGKNTAEWCEQRERSGGSTSAARAS
jgi:hypothetical protein